MAYEQKPGQGSIFKNDKQGNEARPDYTGTGMTPDGKEIKFSVWVKRPKDKPPYFSVSMQYKDPQPAPIPVVVTQAVVVEETDLPF
jgi:hypothetical protein